jgi:hypothetical protein
LYIHNNVSDPLKLQLRLPDHPEDQLRVEPFPAPRGQSFFIEVEGDLAAIQTTLFQPNNAVYECLMGSVNLYPGQRLGLNRNPETEVVFR